MTRTGFDWRRSILFVLFALAALAVAIFGLRTYRSYVVLRFAYELGAPDVASVRPWMTLGYVARAYGVSESALAEHLDLSPDIDPKTPLRSLARRKGLSKVEYVQRVQEAIVASRAHASSPGASDAAAEPNEFDDETLASLLVYGYPALGLMLMLGAFGVPFPSALAVVVAGSLAAQGEMSWFWAGAVAVASSVLGDLAGYGFGRVLGREFFERRGRWFGLTPALRDSAETFFQKWGMLTVVLSRSLLSFKASAVNFLAGASGYRLRFFLPFAIVGRLIWSLAYLSLGYVFGIAIEAAAGFTNSLGGLLISLMVVALLGFMLRHGHGSFRSEPLGK